MPKEEVKEEPSKETIDLSTPPEVPRPEPAPRDPVVPLN